VIDGLMRPGRKIRLMAAGHDYEISSSACSRQTGSGGIAGRWRSRFVANIKTVTPRSGTIETRSADDHAVSRVQGTQAMVFAGLYPVEGQRLRAARSARQPG
jgi:GTP-binding protein LepA